ncbi:MAG: hypothetical protein ABSD75_21795 [Terriglobales bacterium]|jgi:hypothetical protein
MFRKCLLILIAANAIAIATLFAAAQDSQSSQPAGQTNPQGRARGCGHHHDAPDPEACTAELTNRLNLTPDQQAKVLHALQSESSQRQGLQQDTSLSREDGRTKMREVRTATDSEIRGALDPNQQKEWDELQSRRGHRTRSRDGGLAHDSKPGQQQSAQ